MAGPRAAFRLAGPAALWIGIAPVAVAQGNPTSIDQIGLPDPAPAAVDEIDSARLPDRVGASSDLSYGNPCLAPRDTLSDEVAAACAEAARILSLDQRKKRQDSVVVRDEGVFIRIDTPDGASEIRLDN